MNEEENPVFIAYGPDGTKEEYYPDKTKKTGYSEHFGNKKPGDLQEDGEYRADIGER